MVVSVQYPQSGNPGPALGGAGGYLNFTSQMFELTSDNRSETTDEGGARSGAGGAGGKGGLMHNITLPYVNTVTTETATWDSGKNNIFWGGTDASSGFWDWGWDVLYDIGEAFSGSASDWNEANMEVSNAGFKGPVLRQRHYSWNLINRGFPDDGAVIATICRQFQTAVYPTNVPGRPGGNSIHPPPMWTTTFHPADPSEMGDSKGMGVGVGKNERSKALGDNRDFEDIRGREHPVSAPGAWRWSMDPFTSVLLNVVISPTEATDGVMTTTWDGWPLVTTLKCSFLEIDQVVAQQGYDKGIIPYSWSQNEDSEFFAGGGGLYSSL
jgi:hypothetical protein